MTVLNGGFYTTQFMQEGKILRLTGGGTGKITFIDNGGNNTDTISYNGSGLLVGPFSFSRRLRIDAFSDPFDFVIDTPTIDDIRGSTVTAPTFVRNLKASNTLAIRAAMARQDRNAIVVCSGPSTTRGQSTGAGTAQALGAWPMQLARLLQAGGINAGANNVFGNAAGWAQGTSAANFLSGETRVTFTGGAGPTGIDTVGGNGFGIPAGGTMTFTAQSSVARAEILWRDNGAGKTFSYSVDGGAATNVASTGATVPQRTIVNLGGAGTKVITLAQVAGTPQIIGIYTYDDSGNRREISFLNWGHPGVTSTRLLHPVPDTTCSVSAVQALMAPDLTILDDWAINDWRQSVPIETFQSNLAAGIARGKLTGDVIVTTPLWDGGTTGATAMQDAYAAATIATALAADVPVLDVRASWVSYSAAQAAGLESDTVHPTLTGYGVKANALAEFFRRLRSA